MAGAYLLNFIRSDPKIRTLITPMCLIKQPELLTWLEVTFSSKAGGARGPPHGERCRSVSHPKWDLMAAQTTASLSLGLPWSLSVVSLLCFWLLLSPRQGQARW